MKTISLLSIIVAPTLLHAQLSEIEKQARIAHPVILAAQAESRELRARGSGLLAPFQPMVSLTGVGAFGDDAAIFATSFEPRNYLFAPNDPVGIGSMMAMWTLFSGGRDRSAADVGAALRREGDALETIAHLDVALGIRVAYAEAEAARGALAARATGVQAAKELLEVTLQRFEAGSAPEAFVLKARADLARAERLRAVAEADAKGAAARLLEAAGLSPADGTDLGEWDLVLTAPPTLEAAILEAQARPEISLAEARARAARSKSIGVRQSAYPELNLVGMGTGMATDGESDVFYKVGLVLSLPLTDGGMRRAEAAEMAARSERELQNARAVRLMVEREVTTAWALWEASPAALAASEAEVTSAEEAYRIARLRYAEGKAAQVEVAQAAADLVDAVSGRFESNAFRRIAWAKLMRAVGKFADQEDQIK